MPMTCRKRKEDVRTGDSDRSGRSKGGVLKTGPCGIRHDGSVNLDTGFCLERENLSSRCKGRRPSGEPHKALSTDAGHRDRAIRSRDERSVMELDRRGRGVDALLGSQPATGAAA